MPPQRFLCLLSTLSLGAGCVGDAPGGSTTPADAMEPGPRDPQPTMPLLQSIATGGFRAIAPYTNIGGRALMVRTLDGNTNLSISITGVSPTVMYTAHLHAAPCQFAGGGHYKIDPAVTTTVETNELWLKGTSTDGGVVTSLASFTHKARGDALSVVIHDPNSATPGAKMACADLVADEPERLDFAGNVAPFAAAMTIDQTITGTIAAVRTSGGTSFALSLAGLDPAALGYESHIHAQPCEVTAADGHYKLDPTVATTGTPAIDQPNELWLTVTAGAATATSTLQSGHSTRSDAQAIVLHRVTDNATVPPTAIKVACANLARMQEALALETSGAAAALPDAGGMALSGTASLTRKVSGVTEVSVTMTGLAPKTTYMAHVHDLPCSSTPPGGGHFKFDKAITEVIETNELWLTLVSDSQGDAGDLTWSANVADASAQSVVVHAGDGSRLACFDLR